MRQRRVKSRFEIVESCKEFVIEEPLKLKGKWRTVFQSDAPLYLEIGSGKGRFITGLSCLKPYNNFLACEGGVNIYIRILQKAKELSLSNMMLITEYITVPVNMFEDGELDGIYINFCDPWPKDRHAHRRLTYHELLIQYSRIIKKGGFIAFKTDNDGLFEWSINEIHLANLNIERLTRDMHNSPWADENVMTEYEEKFSSAGKSINYLLIRI